MNDSGPLGIMVSGVIVIILSYFFSSLIGDFSTFGVVLGIIVIVIGGIALVKGD